MKVSFELTNGDIRYFRERLKRVRESETTRQEDGVIRSAAKLVETAMAVDLPEFVRVRLLKLEQLVAMLRDDEWRLEGRDRVRILDALAYFVEPEDLIPDGIPGIGYLDDAIMVELVVQELKHEIKAYEDFCDFRSRTPKADSAAKLETRRGALQTRMRRRRRRDRETQRSSSRSTRSPLNLW